MENKRFGFVFGILTGIMSLSFVSALNLDYVTRGMGDVFGWIFGFLLNTTSYDVYFFEKILFLILTFLLIRLGLEAIPSFGDKRGIINIIAVAISLIGVRYLTELDLVKGILIPYGTLTTALLTILPFIVFFFFVHKSIESSVGRRICWIIYMIILVGIWFNRADTLNSTENYIYLGIIIIALILFFFDRKVREYFALAEINEAKKTIDDQQLAKAIKDYIELREVDRATKGSNHRVQRALKASERYLIKNGIDVSKL
jgi:hypothetical protein